MEVAKNTDVTGIVELYRNTIETVNQTSVKLGWDIEVYPNREFVEQEIKLGELFVVRENNNIIAVAAVNHRVNDEYDTIDWQIKEPKDKIATIHALTTALEHRGDGTSQAFLKEIEQYCRENGDLAIHLDVIDTNDPAYKLYTRCGYQEMDCIEMYYESVGVRSFSMMERVL